MVASKIIKHNKKHNLTFDKENHKYFVDGVEYQSVTVFLKKYFPFDRHKIASALAQKNLTTKKEIFKQWDLVRDNGSHVHDLIDRYLKNERLTKPQLNKIVNVLKFIEENKLEILASEVQVFSKKYKLAGTIDLLAKNPKGQILIIDWKTNRKPILKKDVFDMAKHPLSEFPNNKFYQYSMQLSLYSLILKQEYKIDVFDTFLVQLSKDSYQVIDTLNLEYDMLEVLNSIN